MVGATGCVFKPVTLFRGRQGPFEIRKILVSTANRVITASMHNMLQHSSALCTSKMKTTKTEFHSHRLSVPVKACFQPSLWIFSPIWVMGAGSSKGLVHKLLQQFSTLCSSSMKICRTDSFSVVTIHIDHLSHLKHVFGPLHVFLPSLYVLVARRRGGGFQGAGAQTAQANHIFLHNIGALGATCEGGGSPKTSAQML